MLNTLVPTMLLHKGFPWAIYDATVVKAEYLSVSNANSVRITTQVIRDC